jgi:chorismate synthase
MNSFGRLFRLSLFGESHGPGLGVVVDGCPAGLPFNAEDLLPDLARRKPGAAGTTARREDDLPELVSGVHNGRTTGAPILILFRNADTRPGDYDRFRETPRPGHADFVLDRKHGGFNDARGSGHASGRLTLGLVAAGTIAKRIIAPVAVRARLDEAGGDSDIEAAVARTLAAGDSIGGIVSCRVEAAPVGLGEPFFDSVESLLAHLVLSIPAVKGIEFGVGFRAARMKGSEHNDPIVAADGTTATNHAGGLNGGISNGNPIEFRVAVKPTSSIAVAQTTFDLKTGRPETLSVNGRHDACVALRIPVIVEAAAAVVLADLLLLEQRIPRVFGRE